MATALSSTMSAMYLASRPGIGTPKPTTVYDGLVSELAVNDWLPGSRQRVQSIGTAANGLLPITLSRSNGPTITVQWVTGSAIRFAR
jgi:hypothetical protein